jgi:hypothetical protein
MLASMRWQLLLPDAETLAESTFDYKNHHAVE